jgi:predicted aconitase
VLFEGLEPPADDLIRLASFKALGAAMAAAGAVGLFHIAGVTPEAQDGARLPLLPGAPTIAIRDLAPAYAALGGAADGAVDLVFLGCPHLSLAEVQNLAERLRGVRLRARLWVTAARAVRDQARDMGALDLLHETGARLLADTCVVVAPLAEMGVRAVLTDSAKAAIYIPSHHGIPARLANLEQCLAAAETGRWPN